jgi:hypothetical protein
MKRLFLSAAAFAALLTATAAFASPSSTATARLIRVTSPVAPRARATLVARVFPARRCTITVQIKRRRLNARSLHPKRPVHGRVSWTWTIGAPRAIWYLADPGQMRKRWFVPNTLHCDELLLMVSPRAWRFLGGESGERTLVHATASYEGTPPGITTTLTTFS